MDVSLAAFILLGTITVIVSHSYRLLVPAAGICFAGGLVGTLVIWREVKKDIEHIHALDRHGAGSSDERRINARTAFENSLRKYENYFTDVRGSLIVLGGSSICATAKLSYPHLGAVLRRPE